MTTTETDQAPDAESGWYAGRVVCMVCAHEWVAVWPSEARTKAFECPNCGAMAGMPDPEEPE